MESVHARYDILDVLFLSNLVSISTSISITMYTPHHLITPSLPHTPLAQNRLMSLPNSQFTTQ